jgi:uncharacterized protein (TIGR02284 family)
MAGAVERTESLASLHTALVDSRNGYEEALDDAEGCGLSGLFREMIALRDRHTAELARVLASHGREPDRDGSFMSTVHRTIIKVRSLFAELDESILPGLIDGEERILGYYDEAAAEAAGAPYAGIIEQQRQLLRDKLDQMRALQEQSA